jgi:alpha-1,3-mannosyltransferase
MPAACLVLLLTNGFVPAILYLSLTFSAVLIPSLPFLETYPMEYLVNAFDLSRQFLYKWTVNWRFVPEPTFLSVPFAKFLLLCHVILLGAFGFGAWCRKQGGALAVLERALQGPVTEAATASVSQDCESVPTTRPSFMLIMVEQTSRLCSSLPTSLASSAPDRYITNSTHGTQRSYLSSPGEQNILSYFGKLTFSQHHSSNLTCMHHRIMLLAIIEYAWNTYPSTNLSSGLLLAAHVLLLAGVWFGYPEGRNTSIVRWDDDVEVEKYE